MKRTSFGTKTIVLGMGIVLATPSCGGTSERTRSDDENGGTGGRGTGGWNWTGGQDGGGGEYFTGGQGTGGWNWTGGQDGGGGEYFTGGQGTGGGQSGGSLGMGGAVTTAMLGSYCDPPGIFACSDVNPKLAMLCDGTFAWAARETCQGDSVCETEVGPYLGLCR